MQTLSFVLFLVLFFVDINPTFFTFSNYSFKYIVDFCFENSDIRLLGTFFLLKIRKASILPGLEVLAFPCNQFLKQSPGSSEQQKKFACEKFKAEYPIFHKVLLNSKDI